MTSNDGYRSGVGIVLMNGLGKVGIRRFVGGGGLT